MSDLTLILDKALIHEAIGDWLEARHPSLHTHTRTMPVLSTFPEKITITLSPAAASEGNPE